MQRHKHLGTGTGRRKKAAITLFSQQPPPPRLCSSLPPPRPQRRWALPKKALENTIAAKPSLQTYMQGSRPITFVSHSQRVQPLHPERNNNSVSRRGVSRSESQTGASSRGEMRAPLFSPRGVGWGGDGGVGQRDVPLSLPTPARCVKHGSIPRMPHPSGLGRFVLGMLPAWGCCVGPSCAWGTPLTRGTPTCAWDPRDAAMQVGCRSLGFIAQRAGFRAPRDALGKEQRPLAHPGEATQTSPCRKPRWCWVSLNFGMRGRRVGADNQTCSKPTRQKGPPWIHYWHSTYPHPINATQVGNFKDTHTHMGRTSATPPPRNASKPHSPTSQGVSPTSQCGMCVPGMDKRGPQKGWRGDGGQDGSWGGMSHL